MDTKDCAASSRSHQQTLEDYQLRLQSSPGLSLSAYCREVNVSYSRVIDWCKRNGIGIRDLKRKIANGYPACDTGCGMMVQFRPSPPFTQSCLRGVSITFSDGVNLTLQESSVENVVSLLTLYQSRQGGVSSSCSD